MRRWRRRGCAVRVVGNAAGKAAWQRGGKILEHGEGHKGEGSNFGGGRQQHNRAMGRASCVDSNTAGSLSTPAVLLKKLQKRAATGFEPCPQSSELRRFPLP